MTDPSPRPPRRRAGDPIPIAGDYQYRALTSGFVVQRFWHHLKIQALLRTSPPHPGETVVDVGCGSGVVADLLAGHAAEVHALDANPLAIAFARARFAHPNLHFHLGLAEEVEFAAGHFDRAYLLEFVEHLSREQLAPLFDRLRRWLKPGATVFLTTPNYHSAWPAIEFVMDRLRLAPEMGGVQHVTRATRGRLTDLAAGCGFEQLEVGRAVGLAPFVSPFGWRLAGRLDGLERRLGSPLGNLLYALWRRP